MIRRATSADLDGILRIERAAFSAPHWPWEAYEQMLIGAEPGDLIERALFVWASAGHIQGFAGGSLFADEAQLESIAVDAAARRQGLGAALCLAFLAWARERGAEHASLEVRAGSEGVQRLYSSLGFVAVGRRPRYYSNPVEDGVLMRCSLEQKTKVDGLPVDSGPHV